MDLGKLLQGETPKSPKESDTKKQLDPCELLI